MQIDNKNGFMKTRITEMLGIQYPIIQSGMAWIANPSLVTAVCKTGAMAFLVPDGLSAEDLRQQIRQIRNDTGNKPFGVNITPMRPGFRQHVQVMLEEKIVAWSSGLRDPFAMASIKKPENIVYIPTVGSVKQAIKVEKAGADAVIVQGWEGGGHAGRIATTVLIPEVVSAVSIPVIAAGGFCDGKGLVTALALGAEGIAMGTRFVTTQESPLPAKVKAEYLKAVDTDAVLSTIWDGLPMRVIPGAKMKHYKGWWTHFWRIVPALLDVKKFYKASWKDLIFSTNIIRQMHASMPQFLMGMDMYRRSFNLGAIDKAYSPCGQVVGRVNEIPTCQEVVQNTINEAREIIRNLYNKYLD